MKHLDPIGDCVAKIMFAPELAIRPGVLVPDQFCYSVKRHSLVRRNPSDGYSSISGENTCHQPSNPWHLCTSTIHKLIGPAFELEVANVVFSEAISLPIELDSSYC